MKTESSVYAEIHHLFGPIDDHRAVEIMDLDPSSGELEIAAAYFAGLTDVMGEERRPLSGTAAKIYEIVSRDEDLLDEEDHRV
jgi:predicted translin family RNA/ssDNA-binding protein